MNLIIYALGEDLTKRSNRTSIYIRCDANEIIIGTSTLVKVTKYTWDFF